MFTEELPKIDISFNNDFEKQLEVAGYRWFRDMWKNSIRGFQKKFTDESGVKYFITGYHYNHYKQGLYTQSDKDSYMFDVQISLNDAKGTTLDFQYNADFLPNPYDREVTTLKDVEDYFENLWVFLGKPYYEKYNY